MALRTLESWPIFPKSPVLYSGLGSILHMFGIGIVFQITALCDIKRFAFDDEIHQKSESGVNPRPSNHGEITKEDK